MLTEQEIVRMFEEIGLGSEEERARLTELARLASDEQKDEEQLFIRAAATTTVEQRAEDAELE